MKNGNLIGRLDARFLGILAVIAVAAALRLVPHPANFSPIAAMALFGGAYLGRRSFAALIPLAAMFISDLVLGFHEMMPAVYASFVLVALLGSTLKSERSALRIGGSAVAGSLIFFAITNFAVWMQSGMYEKSVSGLIACYVMALPFLQNAIAGDVVFAAAFFGAFALAARSLPALREA